MTKSFRPRVLSLPALLALLVMAPAVGKADGGAAGMPENARAKGYGPGWECDRGYRPVGETCAAVAMPKNAHLDYSGNNWGCNPPYQRRQEQCALL